ncbi:type 2 lanthipeptide synthetase LanM [Chryseobacterium salviniae]|uniref:Type 2 lanthipeptide synthetase LanM n=1 Tax=Chryseobacterium salviniae TaxID=3101750 RepID=A0ABU6HT55_9FLAO|nr:type 2 lanthipeptide synthetase LanM [Chryseobacterium sp. T9W2-O]MEC3875861.1 type 2 lanthipeptide synthetase LanM [Chryseobacterium sp. T9W2-O]
MKNQIVHSVENEHESIPFADILLHYTENFVKTLENRTISVTVKDKLHQNLLQEMSSAAEITLQEELNHFKNSGENFYPDYTRSALLSLPVKYPVLDKMLTVMAENYALHVANIFSNFHKDIDLISETFSIANDAAIIDIDTSLGDGHGGESTALITLSGGFKLIYKPRSLDTSVSYNLFIDWVNAKLDVKLKTLKCINLKKYGWLEFVPYVPVDSDEELKEYYYKAGILLAVTFLLGSKDYHSENLIAAGKDPVIIDHETIIQPVLKNQPSIRTWDEAHKIPEFSVLESMLIVNQDTGATLQCAGYGVAGNVETMDMEMKIIHPNTIDSKRETRFVFRKLIKQNIPVYNGKNIFVTHYKASFLKGFSAAYDLFMNAKEELLSPGSPVNYFSSQKTRYIWRPTFVYFRILKYMRGAAFMASFEAYHSKLYELMSKAYQKEGFKNLQFILDSEMAQMLKGDIPFFNLNSSDSHLQEGEIVEIFKYNCVENIRQRIHILSEKHKDEQTGYILKWLDMNA